MGEIMKEQRMTGLADRCRELDAEANKSIVAGKDVIIQELRIEIGRLNDIINNEAQLIRNQQ